MKANNRSLCVNLPVWLVSLFFWLAVEAVAGPAGPTNPASATASVPNGQVGEVSQIVVTLRDENGKVRVTPDVAPAAFVASVSGANTLDPLTAVDNGDGTFTLSYTPSVAGEDSIAIAIDIGSGAVPIAGSPFTSTVSDGIVSVDNTLVTFSPGVAGQELSIGVFLRDSSNRYLTSTSEVVTFSVSGANTVSSTLATNQGNGSYLASYTPTNTGTDEVSILVNGVAPVDSPYLRVIDDQDIRVSQTARSTLLLPQLPYVDPSIVYRYDEMMNAGLVDGLIQFYYQAINDSSSDYTAVELTVDFHTDALGGVMLSSQDERCVKTSDADRFVCDLGNVAAGATTTPVQIQAVTAAPGDVFSQASIDVGLQGDVDPANSLTGLTAVSAAALLSQPDAYLGQAQYQGVRIADLDPANSNGPDVVFFNAGRVDVFLNDGAGQFASTADVSITTAGTLADLQLGDIDGDTVADMLLVYDDGIQADEFRINDQTPALTAFQNAGTTLTDGAGISTAALISDLDGDGVNELVAAKTESVRVYDNTGAQLELIGLPEDAISSFKMSISSLAAEDVYLNDGKRELLFGNRDGSAMLWFNEDLDSDTATVFDQSNLLGFGPVTDAVFANLDNDSFPDIFLAREFDTQIAALIPESYLLRGEGNGDFAAPKTYGISPAKRALVVDADNDGDDDLFLVYTNGQHRLLVNQGSALVYAPQVFSFADATDAAAADLNGDGLTDLVIAASTGDEGNGVFWGSAGGLGGRLPDVFAQHCSGSGFDLVQLTSCVNAGKQGEDGFGAMSPALLLVLLLLALFRRCRHQVKWLVPVIILLASPSIQARDVFLQLDAGKARFEQQPVEQLETGFVGFRVMPLIRNDWFFSAQLMAGTRDDRYLHGGWPVTYELDWGYDLQLRKEFYFQPKLIVYGQFGYSYVQTRVQSVPLNFEIIDSAQGGTWGVGAGWLFSENFALTVGYQQLPEDSNYDFSAVSIGLRKRN